MDNEVMYLIQFTENKSRINRSFPFFAVHPNKIETTAFMNLQKPFATAFLFTLIFLPFLALAQTDFVVKLSGDTLKGTVKIIGHEQIERVQIISGGAKTTFTGLQVRSVGMDNNVYKALKYENTVRFMRVIKSGYLSLYAFNLDNQNTWNDQFLAKLDGTGMEVPNLSFKKILGKYLSDCPDVRNRIYQGDITKRDIERIVDLYNACMQTKTEATSIKPVDPAMVDSEKVLAVKNLIVKVEAENFITKKDALDLLNDIQAKVKKNEAVPNYLTEGLKSYLAEAPSLSKDLESLIVLLKK